METSFTSHSGNQRIILIFLGWGMDATPFAQLTKPGYDILTLSNYSTYDGQGDFAELIDMLTPYWEIVVMAWSFGVRIASDFINCTDGRLPLTRTIAINGTEQHVDNLCGIPKAIFTGTLQNLSETTVRKFRRRMFASANDFATFMQCAPKRPFSSLLDELQHFATLPGAAPARWDRAIIGNADAIFPPENQKRAWSNIPSDVVDGMTHFPDFQQIINQYIIDKDLVSERFTKAQGTYRINAAPQKSSATKLWELTKPHVTGVSKATHLLEIGVGDGLLTELYLPTFSHAQLTLWDIAQMPALPLPEHAQVERVDAETAIRTLPSESVDVVLSSSTLQWFNSPAGFIRETSRVLRPGGIAAFSIFGSETFKEIATVGGTALRYPSIAQLLHAASETMETVECIEETSQIKFPTAAHVLRHIKQTGVNAISRDANGNATAIKILRHYPANPDGTAPLSYHTIFLILKKTKSVFKFKSNEA